MSGSSLVTQPPKTHVKKGSGNIVYNELSQRNSIIAYVAHWNVINVHVKFVQETIDGFIHSSLGVDKAINSLVW